MRKNSLFLMGIAFLLIAFLPAKAAYSGTIGSEFPIATSAGQEFSWSAAFDGTNYLVGILGDGAAANNITAQLVSQSGALVGSRISVGSTGDAPNVAFDGTNYLLIWGGMGQFISKTGSLVGSPFATGASPDNPGSIIFDGTNYFVVWDASDNVYGQFITPSGTLLGSAISVSTAAYRQRDPVAAYDGTNIMVVWSDGRNQSACHDYEGETHCYESDIYGQLVTKSSTGVAGSLSGSNFLINAGSLPRDGTNPAIAFDGTTYFIAFAEETTFPIGDPEGPGTWYIYGQFVSTAGAAVGGTVSIKTDGDNFLPAVAFDGTKYLIAWNDRANDTDGDGACDAGEGTCWDVYGRLMSTSGTLIGSEFIIDNAAGNQLGGCAGPAVNGKLFCFINTGFVSLGQWGDVYGVFFTTTYYILHRDGAIWSSDTGWEVSTPPYYPGTAYAKALEVREDASYVILHYDGAIYDSAAGWVMTSPPYYPGTNYAVDLKVTDSGEAIILHRDGAIWSTSGGWTLTAPPYYPGTAYAKALEVRDDASYAILHRDGAIYDSASDWVMTSPPYYPGTAYAVDMKLNDSAYVILHQDGALWSSDTGWTLTAPPYYPTTDYARALVLVGAGYKILHRDGAIYDSATGWVMTSPPYYPGTAYAVDLEVR
jgi:hypothetical protein